MDIRRKWMIILKSIMIAYAVTGIILCVLAFFMYRMESGTKIAEAGVTATYGIACVLSGFFAGKKVASRKYLWGLVCGLLYFIILFILSITLHQNPVIFDRERMTSILLCAAGGMLGGMIA